MVVPLASELVPLTEVAPEHIGEFTTGLADIDACVQVIVIFPAPPTPPDFATGAELFD